MDKNIMAKKLKALRGDKSQAEVANAIGVTPSAYAMYEVGQRVPRDDVKERIAAYFNRSISYIFFDDSTHFELANESG